MRWSKLPNCSQVFYEKDALIILQEKTYAGVSSFLKKISPTGCRKTPAQLYSCEFYQIFQNNFFAEHLCVTASAKYSFLFATWNSARKNASFNRCYFKYFRDTLNYLRTALCGSPRQTICCD